MRIITIHAIYGGMNNASPLEGNTRSLSGKQYSQDLFIQEALQFIRDHAEEPFFLYMPFAIPHLSIQVPDESFAAYRDTIARS